VAVNPGGDRWFVVVGGRHAVRRSETGGRNPPALRKGGLARPGCPGPFGPQKGAPIGIQLALGVGRGRGPRGLGLVRTRVNRPERGFFFRGGGAGPQRGGPPVAVDRSPGAGPWPVGRTHRGFVVPIVEHKHVDVFWGRGVPAPPISGFDRDKREKQFLRTEAGIGGGGQGLASGEGGPVRAVDGNGRMISPGFGRLPGHGANGLAGTGGGAKGPEVAEDLAEMGA